MGQAGPDADQCRRYISQRLICISLPITCTKAYVELEGTQRRCLSRTEAAGLATKISTASGSSKRFLHDPRTPFDGRTVPSSAANDEFLHPRAISQLLFAPSARFRPPPGSST